MAHKKVGSSKNGRESESKRLGVKIFRPDSQSRKHLGTPARNGSPSRRKWYGQRSYAFALIDGEVVFRKKKGSVRMYR